MARVRAATIAVLAVFSLLPPVTRSQDFSDKVDRIFNAIDEGKSKVLWSRTRELEELGRGAVEDVRKGLRRASPWVRIAAAKYLYTHDFKKESTDVLLKLATESNDDEARKIAASLLAGLVKQDVGIDKKERREIADSIVRAARGAEDELAKVNLWLSVYSLMETLEAKRAIIGIFEKATDKDTKDEAALALAEMDAFLVSGLKAHLRELAKEPTERGKLARNYLKLNALSEEMQRKLSEKTGETPDGKSDYPVLREIVELLKKHYHDPARIEKELDKLLDNAARGIATGLDDYTTFLSEEELEKMQKEDLEGEYGGIGARVQMRRDRAGDAWLTITEPIYGGPAYKAGLRSNDRIIEIEGESTANQDLQALVRRLRGKPGTQVKIKVWSLRWEKPREFTLTRETIKLDTVQWERLPGGIGYIKLNTFGMDDDKLIREAIDEMKDARGLILDLRGNSGGYLDTAIKIANIFLDPGKVVVSVKSQNPNETSKDWKTSDDKYTDLPLVVLVDGGSASASEILAGALRDHRRALLVGEKTFGKGSVQRTYRLESKDRKAAVKITVARWYLPGGESVEKDDKTKSGIEPTVKVTPPERDLFKEREFERLRASPALQKYVLEQFEKNRKLLQELAVTDGGDVNRYPNFDELYRSLDTRASRDEVRELVREYVRQVVQDDRKKEFPFDFQTDVPLQRAIVELAKVARIDVRGVKEYETFSAAPKKDEPNK